MRFPGDTQRQESGGIVAAEDAAKLSGDAALRVEQAVGVEWYERATQRGRPGGADALPPPSREGGRAGLPHHGDEAVRAALSEVSAPAVVWLASRAISYMDEAGFPDDVAPWFRDEEPVARGGGGGGGGGAAARSSGAAERLRGREPAPAGARVSGRAARGAAGRGRGPPRP